MAQPGLPGSSGAGHGESGRGFRRDIEGLRGLAILLVIAYHAHVPGFTGGYVGVDVFFVVSGYLITGLLVEELRATARVDFPAFYARRVRRLLPAAVTVVLATLLLGRVVYAPVDHWELAKSGLATSLYASNIYFARSATDYLADAGSSPLLHTWSLAVEEQFYLFWPAIVLLAFAWRARLSPARLAWVMVGLGAGSYVLCVRLTAVSQPWAFFLLPPRAWEFTVGALAGMVPATWCRPSPRMLVLGWTGLLAVLAAALGFGAETAFPGAVALIPVAGTGLMLIAGAAGDSTGPLRLLVNRPVQWIGRMSYAWYLWHWPVLIFAREFRALSGTVTAAALSLMSLGLAALTHAFIENPIRFSPALRLRPGRSLALGLGLTGLGAGAAVVVALAGAREARAPGQRIYTEARELPPIYADGCHLSLAATEVRPCVYGDTGATPVIVLFGDSHAAQWFPALEVVARERHERLVSLTKSACPAAMVSLGNQQLGRAYAECSLWRERAMQRILALRPAAVVVANYSGYIALPDEPDRWTLPESEWRAGLSRTLHRFDSAGIRTVLLADTPFPGLAVLPCLARAAWSPALYRDSCEFPRVSRNARVSHQVDREVADEIASAEAVDLTDAICATETCRPQVGGMVVFRDAHHLTTRFAASLAEALGRHIPAEGLDRPRLVSLRPPAGTAVPSRPGVR